MNNFIKSLSNSLIQTAFSLKSQFSTSSAYNKGLTLEKLHKHYVYRRENPVKQKVKPLSGKPYAKGIVLRTVIKKPRKPNSANRKCIVVKLSTGKEMFAYVPGEGHNLQEHQTVLCKGGKLQDTPGVKITCVRGKYDLAHVQKK